MKNFLNIWLLALTIVGVAQSLVVIDSTLASACLFYLKTLDFGCEMGGMSNMSATMYNQYSCLCTNDYFLGSAAVCVIDHNNNTHLVDHAFRHLNGRCQQKAGITVTREQFQSYYDEAENNTRPVMPYDFTESVLSYVTINETDWNYYHKSYKDFAFEAQRSGWFGWGLVFYWVTVLLVAGLFNLNDKIFHFKVPGKFANYIRRSWTLPLVFGTNREQIKFLFKFIPFRVPTKWDSFVVTIFVILSCIFCGIGYTLKMPNAFNNNRYEMNLDLVSYRTDLMLCSLFPIIYLFGIRNNIFIPLTGLSFANFNYYHKWCAYIMFMLSMIHSAIWTQYYIMYGTYKLNIWTDPYLQWGIVLTTFAGFLVFMSFKYFRDASYEFFLLIHKIFNVIFIVSMYYHVKGMIGMNWVWSMVGIWCTDRVLRWVRILLSGGIQSSTCTMFEDGVIKLTIKKPKLMNYKSGSYLFFYFMSPWYLLWQSHPFTVISSPIVSESGELVVCFRLRKGITGRLLKHLMKSSVDGKSLNLRFILEGPYGGESLFSYSDYLACQARKGALNMVTAISGGMGIVAVFPHLAEILKDVEPECEEVGSDSKLEKEDSNSSSSLLVLRHRSYKLIWYINSLSHVQWFQEELKWLMSRGCQVSIVITRDLGLETDSESVNYNGLESVEKHFANSITLDLDKSKFGSIVHSEFGKAVLSEIDLTIFSCGPSSFNDALRAQVVDVLNCNKESNVNLNYRPESFTW